MSDENAVPEVPAEPLKSEATPGTWVSGQPETFTPATVVVPVAPADDLASRIAALEPVAQALLTETLNHVLDGFVNHSLVLGMTRLTGLLK